MGHCAAARGQHASVLGTVQTQDQHIQTSLCLGDYNAGNWLEIFHHPVKAKLAVMLNPRGKIRHLCHSSCTCMLIPSCVFFWAWPRLGWPCTWRKKPPYVITKAVAPSAILAAGCILGISDLWDSELSCKKRWRLVPKKAIYYWLSNTSEIIQGGDTRPVQMDDAMGKAVICCQIERKKNYLMHCRHSSPALIFNRNVPL